MSSYGASGVTMNVDVKPTGGVCSLVAHVNACSK